jgi:hypothetical protein
MSRKGLAMPGSQEHPLDGTLFSITITSPVPGATGSSSPVAPPGLWSAGFSLDSLLPFILNWIMCSGPCMEQLFGNLVFLIGL